MHDVIIIGAGHNGLVCATYLAKAGLKVLIVERRDIVGGACVSQELWPGYKVSTGAYNMSLLQPKIILDLELKKHGLDVVQPTPTFGPLEDGRALVFWSETDRFCAELAKLSEKDAKAYPRYLEDLRKAAEPVKKLLWETPVDPTDLSFSGLARTARFLLRYRRDIAQFYKLYDILTMSAYDYLSKWFESEEVIAALGYYVAGSGTNRTMTMPGTAFTLLRPALRDHSTSAGPGGHVRGGMGAITTAMALAATKAGAEIRTGCEASEILRKGNATAAVKLTSGEELQATTVVSNLNAKATVLGLLPENELPEDYIADVRNIRTKSSIFKIHLAVSELPKFKAFSADNFGFDYPSMVRIGASVDYLERAYDEHKSGRPSKKPFLTISIPSAVDSDVAPKGEHLIQIMGGHAPCSTNVMSNEELREDILDKTLRTIARHAPGFGREAILHNEVLTPRDLAARFGLPDGHVHHGDLTADQIFFRRPAPHYSDYRTPVGGLYLCGSAVHPGGGVTGVPGHNAAREILSDLKMHGPVLKNLKRNMAEVAR